MNTVFLEAHPIQFNLTAIWMFFIRQSADLNHLDGADYGRLPRSRITLA